MARLYKHTHANKALFTLVLSC